MKIRCRAKPTFMIRNGRRYNYRWPHYLGSNGEPQPYMKFRCRWCKAWVCGVCEGTHDDADPVGNRICDPCWARRERRKKGKPSDDQSVRGQ